MDQKKGSHIAATLLMRFHFAWSPQIWGRRRDQPIFEICWNNWTWWMILPVCRRGVFLLIVFGESRPERFLLFLLLPAEDAIFVPPSVTVVFCLAMCVFFLIVLWSVVVIETRSILLKRATRRKTNWLIRRLRENWDLCLNVSYDIFLISEVRSHRRDIYQINKSFHNFEFRKNNSNGIVYADILNQNIFQRSSIIMLKV